MNVKVVLPDLSKTAVSPQTVSSVSVSKRTDCSWTTCGGGGLGCRSGHQQGDQQTQRCRGEPTGYRPHRHGPSLQPLPGVLPSAGHRLVPVGSERPSTIAAKGLRRGGDWPAGARGLPAAIQGVPSVRAGGLLPLPLRWLGPTTSLGASVGRNIRGGFKPWLRLATVLDLHRDAATQQEAARIDSEPTPGRSGSARGAAAEPVSQRAAGPARSSTPPSVGSGLAVSRSGASAT